MRTGLVRLCCKALYSRGPQSINARSVWAQTRHNSRESIGIRDALIMYAVRIAGLLWIGQRLPAPQDDAIQIAEWYVGIKKRAVWLERIYSPPAEILYISSRVLIEKIATLMLMALIISILQSDPLQYLLTRIWEQSFLIRRKETALISSSWSYRQSKQTNNDEDTIHNRRAVEVSARVYGSAAVYITDPSGGVPRGSVLLNPQSRLCRSIINISMIEERSQCLQWLRPRKTFMLFELAIELRGRFEREVQTKTTVNVN